MAILIFFGLRKRDGGDRTRVPGPGSGAPKRPGSRQNRPGNGSLPVVGRSPAPGIRLPRSLHPGDVDLLEGWVKVPHRSSGNELPSGDA